MGWSEGKIGRLGDFSCQPLICNYELMGHHHIKLFENIVLLIPETSFLTELMHLRCFCFRLNFLAKLGQKCTLLPQLLPVIFLFYLDQTGPLLAKNIAHYQGSHLANNNKFLTSMVDKKWIQVHSHDFALYF